MVAIDRLIQQWRKDEQAIFKGWDFSYIKNRYKEESPNWNYKARAKQLIKKSKSVLDMATGGGEVFSEILSAHRPKKAVAIEGYKPNVSVAADNLKKHKVKVIFVEETKKLPFKKNEFDLVLNRHGGFNVKELARIITPKGIFFTQQVTGSDEEDLHKIFNSPLKWKNHTLTNTIKKLGPVGFEIIDSREWEGKYIYNDVGALVYHLKAVPWIVPNFSVKKYKDVLKKLHEKAKRKGRLEFVARRFLILAKKK